MPADYRRFLNEFGGAYLGSEVEFKLPPTSQLGTTISVEAFYGIYLPGSNTVALDLKYHINTLCDRIPDWAIPIAGAFYGNRICLAISGVHSGSIYFWDHEDPATELSGQAFLFSPFQEFLESGSCIGAA